MGCGFDKQDVERVNQFFKALPYADVVVFPWTNNGDLVDFIIDEGFNVWGAGLNTQQLELNRQFAKSAQIGTELHVGKYELVQGIEPLFDKLKVLKDVYVKFNVFREIETFHHVDWQQTLAQYVGPILHAYGTDPTVKVMVEWPLEGPECGSDVIVVNGKTLNPRCWGWEEKDAAHIGVIPVDRADHPYGLYKVLKALQPKYANATTFLSTECHMAADGSGTLNDVTVRTPHPLMSGFLAAFTNLPEVIVQGARGKAVQLHSNVNYFAVLVLYSNHNKENYLEVEVDPKQEQWVKLQRCFNDRGRLTIVPGGEILGHVVGIGNSVQQAITGVEMAVKGVKARELTYDLAALYKIRDETIPNGRKHGIPF